MVMDRSPLVRMTNSALEVVPRMSKRNPTKVTTTATRFSMSMIFNMFTMFGVKHWIPAIQIVRVNLEVRLCRESKGSYFLLPSGRSSWCFAGRHGSRFELQSSQNRQTGTT